MKFLLRSLKTLFVAGALTVAVASQARADDEPQCFEPDTPAIPDGSRSSEEEMQDARQAVTEYLAANAHYRECLAEQIAATAEQSDVDPRLKAVIDEYIAEAYDTAELVADTFNHNLRKYQSANN